MTIISSAVRRIRDLIGVIGGFFEQPRVTRHITVPGSGTGFTVPDPSALLPLNDRLNDRHIPQHPRPGAHRSSSTRHHVWHHARRIYDVLGALEQHAADSAHLLRHRPPIPGMKSFPREHSKPSITS